MSPLATIEPEQLAEITIVGVRGEIDVSNGEAVQNRDPRLRHSRNALRRPRPLGRALLRQCGRAPVVRRRAAPLPARHCVRHRASRAVRTYARCSSSAVRSTCSRRSTIATPRSTAANARAHEIADDVEHAVDARTVQGHPAVDHDVLPGDEAGQVGAQEHDDVGDVVGLPDPGEGRLRRHGVAASSPGSLEQRARSAGVAIIPGDTALTRIVGAYSSAADAVSAATAALAAA